jgi:hypothetical protein
MTIQRTKLPAIIVVASVLAILITSTVTPAFAIKNFFNCMTDIANQHGKLSIDDVNMCLHREYSVYRNTQYPAHGQGAGW